MSTPTKTTLDEKQRQALLFTVGLSTRFAYLCPLAQAFASWCEVRVETVRDHPTEVSLNQALLGLQEEWHSRLTAAPKAHRGVGSSQHTCLSAVYIDFVRELRELRSWKVNPPLVREAPPVVEQKFELSGSFVGIKK